MCPVILDAAVVVVLVALLLLLATGVIIWCILVFCPNRKRRLADEETKIETVCVNQVKDVIALTANANSVSLTVRLSQVIHVCRVLCL